MKFVIDDNVYSSNNHVSMAELLFFLTGSVLMLSPFVHCFRKRKERYQSKDAASPQLASAVLDDHTLVIYRENPALPVICSACSLAL